MSVLAVDLGTSGVKAAVVRDDATVLGHGAAPVVTTFGPGGAAEQDPRAWWDATADAARAALQEAGRADPVEAVCCTSQWATTVAVDRDGEPVGPALTWMDTRGAPYARPLLDRESVPRWVEIHGLVPAPSGQDGLGHMLWWQRERPETYALTAAFLEPMDYLALRFTGQVAATQTTAMPFVLADNRTLGACAWSDELVTRAGVDGSKLPPLVPADAILGEVRPEVAGELGLRRGLPVIAGANDTITAALGSGALDRGEATAVIGTTAVLAAHHPERVTDLGRAVFTVPSVFDDRWFLLAENGIGGRALDALLHQVVYGDDPLATGAAPDDAFRRAEEAAAAVAPGCDGVVFAPWLAGSLAPAPDGNQRGAFIGLCLTTTRAHLVRAVLEGVALNLRWLRDELAPLLGVSWPRVRFAGGGAESDLWGAILADALAVPVEQLAQPRLTNARGTALLALVRLGRLAFDDLRSLVRVRRLHEPRSDHTAIYDEMAPVLTDLHRRLADTYRSGPSMRRPASPSGTKPGRERTE